MTGFDCCVQSCCGGRISGNSPFPLGARRDGGGCHAGRCLVLHVPAGQLEPRVPHDRPKVSTQQPGVRWENLYHWRGRCGRQRRPCGKVKKQQNPHLEKKNTKPNHVVMWCLLELYLHAMLKDRLPFKGHIKWTVCVKITFYNS